MRLTTWLNVLKNRKTRCQRPRRRSASPSVVTLSTESLEERRLLSVNPLTDMPAESGDSSPLRILVQMRDAASTQQTIHSMNVWAAHVQAFRTPGLMSVELPDGVEMQSALDAWNSNPEVQFAEPDYVITAGQFSTSTVNDPGFDTLYGLHNTGQTGGLIDADIEAPEAWSITTGDGSVVVAVIDSGVDYTHEDLAANIWTNPGEIPGNGVDDDGNGFVDDIHGFDFFAGDNDPQDELGHGTHVAGTIGAVADNGIGVTGVIHNVQIMPVRFLGPEGSGTASGAIQAIEYAVANGAVISNNSWGGGPYSPALQSAIEYARDAGHIFVAAAGNSSANHDVSPRYPASYQSDNVVAVAATDHNDQLASFSDYGRTTVHLGAPGVDILSTTPGNTYSVYSGTSMATPHVAGTLALIRSQHPDWSHLQVIHQLMASADPVASLNGLTLAGRVNAASALNDSIAGRGMISFDKELYAVGESVTVRVIDADLVEDDTISVIVQSSGGDALTLQLTSIDPGVFEGTLPTDDGTVDLPESLSLTSGATITATYQDASDHTGTAATVAVTAGVFVDDHGNNADSATTVGSNSFTYGDIELSGDRDWFRFDANTGATYEILTATGSLSDTTLTLYDQDGTTQLDFDDDGGPGLASRLVWTALQDGFYYVAVAAYSSTQTGSYTLNLTDLTTPPPVEDDHGNDAVTATPVVVPSSTVGDIEITSDTDWFRFDAASGTTYDVAVVAGSLPGSSLALYDQDGTTVIAYADDNGAVGGAQFEWLASQSGTYYLAVSEFTAGATGSYTLNLNELITPPPIDDDHGNDAATATPVAVPSSVTGDVEQAGDTDWFQFNTAVGTTYEFLAETGSLTDTTLRLYDQDGTTQLVYDDDGGTRLASRIEWTAPQDGIYYLAVAAFGAVGTGDYTLHLTEIAEPPQDALIDISLDFSDTAGQSIELIHQGDEFLINVYATDLREGADWQGVLSAIADVHFDPTMITVTGIQHVFDDLTFGEVLDGEVDEAGGLLTTRPAVPFGRQLVFRLTATAIGRGSVTIETSAGEHFLSENQVIGIDGDQREATRYGRGTITVAGQLGVVINAESVPENAGRGAVIGVVTRQGSSDMSEALVVTLHSSDTSEATVPETVIIEVGQISATFLIDIIDDNILDGTQTVTIVALATGFTDGADTFDVTDVELADLTVVSLDVLNDYGQGGSLRVSVTIANSGTGPAGAFQSNIVLSRNDQLGDSDDDLVRVLELSDGLPAGEQVTQELDLTDARASLFEWALEDDAPGLGIGHISNAVYHTGLFIDVTNAVTEIDESNNDGRDDINYFPWDTTSDGRVTLVDVGYGVNRLGGNDPTADIDGNGTVTPTDIAVVQNRVGYFRNDSVTDAAGISVSSISQAMTGASLTATESRLSSSDPVIEIAVVFTDTAGNRITEVVPGQELYIAIHAHDLREDMAAAGVLSSFADVFYNNSLIEVVGLTSGFESLQTGELNDATGTVLHFGGLQNSGSATVRLVGRLNAIARTPGIATVSTAASEGVLFENTLRMMDSDLRNQTRFSSASIEIVDSELAQFENGLLSITVPESSAVALTVSPNGTVDLQVNGTSQPIGSIPALDVTAVTIEGSTGADQIDLSGLTTDDLPNLQSLRIRGNSGDDIITLSEFVSASSTVNGGDGNDVITGGPGNDVLSGDGGNDTISGNAGSDTLAGSDGDDLLSGGSGDDLLMGDAGDDVLRGGAGRDVLDGGIGDDLVLGQGASGDSLTGGLGDDTLDGGGSAGDRVVERGDVNFTLTDTSLTGLGRDVIIGIGRATLWAGDSDNVIDASGFSGFTRVIAQSGDDLVRTGQGGSNVFGGRGRDTLIGGTGSDKLFGQGSSGDQLTGADGDDTLDGGSGNDTVVEYVNNDESLTATDDELHTIHGRDRLRRVERLDISGGSGANTIDVSRFPGSVTLRGGAGDDLLIGSNLADLLLGDEGNDTVIANGGADRV